MDAHREDLIRMTTEPVEMRAADDGNTLVGYPIVWDQWTEIAGWEGNFLERVAPTAADKTLAERGNKVKVLFNHGFDPSIGDKPLGKPAVMEPRDFGLWTETPLADTSYNKDIRELLSVGAVDGMSFRFSIIRDEWNDEPDPSDINPKGLPERTIKEFRLYEFGPVTFPAYEATTAGVRAREAYLKFRDATQPGTSHDTTTPPVSGTSLSKQDIARKLREINLKMKGIKNA